MPRKMARQTLERAMQEPAMPEVAPISGSGLLGSPENRYNLPHFRVYPWNPGSYPHRTRLPRASWLRHQVAFNQAFACQEQGMQLQRRTLLSAGLVGLAWTATQGLAAASNTRTRFVFHVSSTWGDLFDWLVDRGYAPITAELEKRGFPSMLVHSSVRGSDTPNEDRASAVVKALQNVTDDVVIVGISNQGNFLPLVAAARPIRRVVYVNALIPCPGKAFIEVCQTEQVAVPGSYLDKLLKASQSITDDF